TRTRIASARIRAAARRGATVATFIADLSSQGAVRRLAADVLARYPKLHVLVNNAGAMYGRRIREPTSRSTISTPSAPIGALAATAKPSWPTSCSRPNWRDVSIGPG